MTTLSRRAALRIACLAATLGAAGCAEPESDPPGTHPARRRPRPAGEIAFLDDAPAAASDDVTIGYGMSWYAARGIAPPPGLTEMPPFPGDVLIPARTNPPVCVQVEADTPQAAAARMDEVLATLPTPTWRTPVHRDLLPPEAGKPLQRNPFGFVEGQANPPGPPGVLRPDGSSLLTVRVIRLAHSSWNTDSADRQARIIGRHPDGTWLDGTPSPHRPNHTADPEGAHIPLDAHTRAMNPGGTAPTPTMLRRSWTYAATEPDSGMVFMAFQSSIEDGFALAQSRLPKDALAPYMLAVGGGYFHVPPAEKA